MKKRLLSLMAAFMLLLTCAVGLSFGGEARAEETVKPIDLYLVGGQSNAAGCSKAVGVDGSTQARSSARLTAAASSIAISIPSLPIRNR